MKNTQYIPAPDTAEFAMHRGMKSYVPAPSDPLNLIGKRSRFTIIKRKLKSLFN